MLERAGVFESDDFDISAFTPKEPAKQQQPEPEAVRAVSENAQFRSREPVPPKPRKADRRHRTGRNIQLNTKVDVETNNLLYKLHADRRDKENWTLGQIIGLALKALERELVAKP